MIADIALHAALGGVFMGTGACVRGMCEHTWHRWTVGSALLLIEATVMVAVVG